MNVLANFQRLPAHNFEKNGRNLFHLEAVIAICDVLLYHNRTSVAGEITAYNWNLQTLAIL